VTSFFVFVGQLGKLWMHNWEGILLIVLHRKLFSLLITPVFFANRYRRAISAAHFRKKTFAIFERALIISKLILLRYDRHCNCRIQLSCHMSELFL
jgi:hypothetical protein